MSERLQPQQVLENIPGWEGAGFEVLHGGLSNRSYVVQKGGKRAVLKLDDQPPEAPLNSRQAEARIQSTATAAGLAGEVLYFDDRCLMTEYVDGVVWGPTDLRNHDKLQQLGQRLRELHSLPLTGRTFDAGEAARRYLGTITTEDTGMLEHCVRIIDAMPAPLNLCTCHNDLVVGNILEAASIIFLDWEYACDNDPFFDLATIAAHHELDEQQRDVLLTAYFGGDWQRWQSHLEQQMRHYEAVLWLWTEARVTSDS